jgi:hypothetical protein
MVGGRRKRKRETSEEESWKNIERGRNGERRVRRKHGETMEGGMRGEGEKRVRRKHGEMLREGGMERGERGRGNGRERGERGE